MNARSTGRMSLSVRGVDEIEIGGIGIDDAAVAVGDDDAVGGAVDHRLDQRIAVSAADTRRMPQASANSENTPMVASTARKARI